MDPRVGRPVPPGCKTVSGISTHVYILPTCAHGSLEGKQSAPVNVRTISRGQSYLKLRRRGENYEFIWLGRCVTLTEGL